MYYFYLLLLCGINVVIEVVCKFSIYFKDLFSQTYVIYILISTKATHSSKYVDLVARTHLYSKYWSGMISQWRLILDNITKRRKALPPCIGKLVPVLYWEYENRLLSKILQWRPWSYYAKDYNNNNENNHNNKLYSSIQVI